jgi:tRNA pseudouridine13 synthase
MVLKPTRPVPRGSPDSRIHGRYKVETDDFVVDELPLYEPSGQGEHVFLHLEKRGIPTLELLQRLGAALRFDPRQFGIAGLKDAQAVARQWVSAAGIDPEAAAGLHGDGFQVLEVARHGNKLRMGHLRGNRFDLRLRGTVPGDLEKAKAALEQCRRLGVPNYFGEQRFGKRGANLDKGLRILHGNPHQAGRRVPRRLLGLLVSAVQSEVFNRVVMERLPALGTLLPGDLAFLHRNGACFRVDDVARDQVRADAFEISPSGPLPGPRMQQPEGAPRAIEQGVLAAMQLDPAVFAGLPHGLCRGDRRPLRVPLWDPAAVAEGDTLRLSFGLPKGSYATSVLRELLVDTIWFAEAS